MYSSSRAWPLPVTLRMSIPWRRCSCLPGRVLPNHLKQHRRRLPHLEFSGSEGLVLPKARPFFYLTAPYHIQLSICLLSLIEKWRFFDNIFVDPGKQDIYESIQMAGPFPLKIPTVYIIITPFNCTLWCYFCAGNKVMIDSCLIGTRN